VICHSRSLVSNRFGSLCSEKISCTICDAEAPGLPTHVHLTARPRDFGIVPWQYFQAIWGFRVWDPNTGSEWIANNQQSQRLLLLALLSFWFHNNNPSRWRHPALAHRYDGLGILATSERLATLPEMVLLWQLQQSTSALSEAVDSVQLSEATSMQWYARWRKV
jgi:hypothetical protein